MKYTLINTTTSADTPVFDVVNEVKDEDGKITTPASETPTDRFFVAITLTIKDTESENDSNFERTIQVESTKDMTGHEVEAQREKAVTDYIANINKD